MDVALSFSSLCARDIVALSDFYGNLFGLEEVLALRSPHFRGLTIGETILGFSGPAVYDLLNLIPPQPESTGVQSFLTFEVPDVDAVNSVTDAAVNAGATCVSAPARTYYGAWQSVLLDPEGNAFRINHLAL
ncbi:putative enzyme related to lactoylglutathione lyase [Rhodococcus sp. 27YEA15]|uniref:VOC family protein n=1 Tax=Rhodococcus sp. 27YEA15 TaxID=3156259 RepID=UPI003C79E572